MQTEIDEMSRELEEVKLTLRKKIEDLGECDDEFFPKEAEIRYVDDSIARSSSSLFVEVGDVENVVRRQISEDNEWILVI